MALRGFCIWNLNIVYFTVYVDKYTRPLSVFPSFTNRGRHVKMYLKQPIDCYLLDTLSYPPNGFAVFNWWLL